MAAQVRHAADNSRYEVHEAGQLAGFAEYVDIDGARVFTHTEVFPEFGGQGLGSQLVREALDHVRTTGLSMVAMCPFVKHFVDGNAQYADLIDAALESRLRSS